MRHQESFSRLNEIVRASNISTSSANEIDTLTDRLIADKFIDAHLFEDGDGLIKLTSLGIDYVEGDSYTSKGVPISHVFYNTNISNSTGISVVTDSQDVNVNITSNSEVNNKLDELIRAINSNTEVSKNQQIEMIQCIDEIKSSISQDRTSKYAFQSLLNIASNFAGIGSLVLEIGKSLPGV
ncbi:MULTISPECIES: hypothetical protein [Sphingobacterium]|uniref:hypothetical protein n=1 Tax=Sphingobacterium TaxID=28453 RepID=UPI0012E090EA|nr:hypothetical protein [Sphingobacterium sp. IITKGP-BTPF85]